MCKSIVYFAIFSHYLICFCLQTNYNIVKCDYDKGGIIMLLEFKIKNYKSFVERTTFSMLPAPKQTGLDYSLLNERAGNKNQKALCSAVIYGPNASGKTNIIGAMET